jgi:hypothetical protein
MGVKYQVYYLVFATDVEISSLLSGARPALPMGVAPKAIVEFAIRV